MSLSSWLGGLGRPRSPLNARRKDRVSTLSTMARHKPIPEDEAGWADRYEWLDAWYLGEPYDDLDVQPLKLFKAVDDSGEVLSMAQRLVQDAQFVVDTDASTLAGGRWSLEPAAGASADVGPGLGVWRRSRWQVHKQAFATSMCALGDVGLQPTPDGKLIAHSPRQFTPVYAQDGITLTSVHVHYSYFDDDGRPHSYRSELTPTVIRTWEVGDSDQPMNEVITPHNLGAVPFIHIHAKQILGCPEHGLWAGHRLERPMAAMDSFLAQIGAIGTRYAHPHLWTKGFRLSSDDQVEQFGRVFSGLPADGEIGYLEAGMGAIAPLWEVLRDYQDRVRATIPEFTLAGSGANTSGRALEFRADQFKRKLRDMQTRLYDGVALATEYAVLLRSKQRYDADRPMYRIKGPPILPIDESARSRTIIDWHNADLITTEDAVRHGQALGLIDDEADAGTYAASLQPAQPAQAAPFVPDDNESPD